MQGKETKKSVVGTINTGQKIPDRTTINGAQEKEERMRTKLIITCLGLAVAAWMFAPTAASAQNHYACYQTKDLKVPDKLVKNQTGSYTNEVEGPEGYEKCKLKYMCVPTDKDSSGIDDAGAYLLCHQCKQLSKKLPKNLVNYDITDQFVNGRVNLKKLKFICNPAAVSPA
jgi:hypothetical protein